MAPFHPRVLQAGLGGFGEQHLKAWQALGVVDRLWIADPDAGRRASAQQRFGIPAERAVSDPTQLFDDVDVVDVVTPTDSHYALAAAALVSGRDVFIEKPMTMNAAEARYLDALTRGRRRIVQVGYSFRWHPSSLRAKAIVGAGTLGDLRYFSGMFMGFKRARRDVGVTQTDAVHFIDLINWLTGARPERVYAVTRDHFGRGLDDLSIVLLDYPHGVVAKVESGYIQPGRWRDRVVAGAMTTKTMTVCGSTATIEIDYEQGQFDLHRVQHQQRDGIWTAIHDGTQSFADGPVGPEQMVAAELESFLDAVHTRQPPAAGVHASVVIMARIVEAIHESAARGEPIRIACEGDATGS